MWLKNLNIKEGIRWEINLPTHSNPILFKEEITILIYSPRNILWIYKAYRCLRIAVLHIHMTISDAHVQYQDHHLLHG